MAWWGKSPLPVCRGGGDHHSRSAGVVGMLDVHCRELRPVMKIGVRDRGPHGQDHVLHGDGKGQVWVEHEVGQLLEPRGSSCRWS